MAKHILSLDIPQLSNEGIFMVNDISIYDTSIAVSCPNLQITPPGYIQPASLTVTPGFRLALNACTMGIMSSTSCADSCPALADGIWDVRYSVSPNDKVFVEYKHFRIVAALNRYYGMLCELNLPCCLPSAELQYQLSQLDIIHNYLISAKVTCEDAHRFDDAINQYRYAIELMDKMSTCKPGCNY